MVKIKLNIDGREVEAIKGKSVLEAALDNGIYIPHLCHHPDLPPIGSCRLCIVQIESQEGLLSSCLMPVESGLKVISKSHAIESHRRLAMEMMLAGHPPDCSSCNKYLNCELQSLKQYLGGEESGVRRRSRMLPVDNRNPLFVHEPDKCVVCGRCVRACDDLRGIGVLNYQKKNRETLTGTTADLPLADAGCKFCGACAEVCPTGAIQDKAELIKGKSRKSALVPCKYTCPVEIDVPRYVRFLRDRDPAAAAAVVREKAPFPAILGYVCDRPCEDECRRGEVSEAISIRALKLCAAEHDDRRIWERKVIAKPHTGKKVAIIGSGPAGLTSAYYLALQGHAAAIFEALPSPGGMLRYGIPEYRLPRPALESEIKYIISRGVEIKTGTRVGSIEGLLAQGFQAVLIAIGTQKGQKLNIPGLDHPAVLAGVDYLREVNLGKPARVGKRFLVLGGGNVALDCARAARRLGAGQVSVACLENREDMPASLEEVTQAEEEGIRIFPARSFTRVVFKGNEVSGVECLKVKSLSFDENKNPIIESDEGSEHLLEADTVICAVGQKPEVPSGFGVELDQRNLIAADPSSCEIGREGVFAAGDAVTGTSSVVKAIASGRKAAVAIDRFLGGDGNLDEKLAPDVEPEKVLGYEAGFAFLKRSEESCLLPSDRLQGFCPVVEGMDNERASVEAGRCLQCDLRLKITSVKFWGNY